MLEYFDLFVGHQDFETMKNEGFGVIASPVFSLFRALFHFKKAW
jgi:hypothetical protein